MAKVYLEDSELTNIGNAIRNKNGATTMYLPSEMPAAIDAIEGGGEKIQVEGDVGYICGYPGYYSSSWLRDNCKNMFKPDLGPITRGTGLCYYMDASFIHSITFAKHPSMSSYNQLSDLFSGAILEELPVLSGPCTLGTNMFSSSYLKRVTSDKVAGLTPLTGTHYQANMFRQGYSLEDVSGLKTLAQNGFVCYAPSNMYYLCYSLKEAYILPFTSISSTSAANLTSAFTGCRALENIEWGCTEFTNTNYKVTLNLSGMGYWASAPTDTFRDTYGLCGPELEVTDLESYNRLKNTNGWWTQDITFSHLNHTNAVRILNNLPTPSYGGTITFKGTMGSGYNDPISNLTEEEIAVATAKNWTVTIS